MTARDKEDLAIARLGLRYDVMRQEYTFIARGRSLAEFRHWLKQEKQVQRRLGGLKRYSVAAY